MSLIWHDTIAAIVFWLTYVAFIALDARLILRSLSGHPPGDTPVVARAAVHRPVGLGGIVAAEVLGLAATFIAAAALPGKWICLAIGLIVAWCGIALRFWAKRSLGRFFVGAVVMQPDHEIIDTGPYAVIRHPGYAGSVLALGGLSLATANAITLAVFLAVPLAIYLTTIPVEEAALTANLGENYADYRKRTGRLLPRLW